MHKKVLVLGFLVICLGAGCGIITKKAVSVEESSKQEVTIAEEIKGGDTAEASQLKYTKEDMDSSFSQNDANRILLGETGISAVGENMDVTDNTVTISKEGTYIVSGSIADGRIEVNLEKSGTAKIVLENASLICKEDAPVNILSGKVILTLAEGTVNYIEDGSSYTLVDELGEPSAAIFSKEDLTVNGTGSLEVRANYRNAIQSKKTLKIVTGTYKINTVESGFVGRGGAMLRNGNYSIASSGKNENVVTDIPEVELR